MNIMPFADRRDRNKSKFTDRIRGKSTDEILEEIKREFGNNSGNSMFFDESDSKRTSPQRVCTITIQLTVIIVFVVNVLTDFSFIC